MAYGLGEATAPVTATGVLSALIAAITGGGGIWSIWAQFRSNSKGLIDTGKGLIEKAIGGNFGLDESSETALLLVSVERIRAGDAEGKDLAFELIQHIRKFEDTKDG